MKKSSLLCLLLALVMSISMVGCTVSDAPVDEDESRVRGTVEAAGDEEDDTTGPAEDETTAPSADAEPPVEDEPEVEPSIGRVEDGRYANSYVGIACQLSDDWTFYSAEQLQELPEEVIDSTDGTTLGDEIANGTQIYDMQAVNDTDGSVVNVVLSKLTLAEILAYADATEEEIIDATLEQSDILLEGYEQAGMVVKSLTKEKFTFLAEERFAMVTECEVDGASYYMVQIYDYDLGRYCAVLTVSAFSKETVQTLLDSFYAI